MTTENIKTYTANPTDEDLATSADLIFNTNINGNNNVVTGFNLWGDTAKLFDGWFNATTTPEVKTIDASEAAGAENIVGNYNDNNIIAGNDAATITGTAGNNNADLGSGWGAKSYFYSAQEGFSNVFNYSSARGDIVGYGKSLASFSRNDYGLVLNSFDGTSLGIFTNESTDHAFNLEFGGQITRAKVAKSYEASSFTQEDNTLIIGNAETQDTVNVYSSAWESKYVNLNESYSSIEVVNGANVLGDFTAIGQDYNDSTLVGGSGNNSLWGGIGSNDIIDSGAGATTIFYGQGNGTDIVANSKESDTLNLMGTTLDQIAFAGQISADFFAVGLTSGETVYLDGNKNRTVVMQNQEYHYEAASASWSVSQVSSAG